VAPIHDGLNRLVWFVYFYQSFDGRGNKVQIDVFLFVTLLFFYRLSDLRLECFVWVGGGLLEVIFK